MQQSCKVIVISDLIIRKLIITIYFHAEGKGSVAKCAFQGCQLLIGRLSRNFFGGKLKFGELDLLLYDALFSGWHEFVFLNGKHIFDNAHLKLIKMNKL